MLGGGFGDAAFAVLNLVVLLCWGWLRFVGFGGWIKFVYGF